MVLITTVELQKGFGDRILEEGSCCSKQAAPQRRAELIILAWMNAYPTSGFPILTGELVEDFDLKMKSLLAIVLTLASTYSVLGL